MIETIDTRELITLDVLGILLRGTYHRPQDNNSEAQTNLSERDRMGIVFVNSLALPRAATGDSAVYWAESFAGCGYPSFRLDLSGLGDSDGDIPSDLFGFINCGGYSELISAAVKKLVERFGMSGVVIVGHCAGTVSALYGAAASKECRGLVLMDPYFYLPQVVRPKVRDELSDWASRSKFGGLLRKIYGSLREVHIFLRRNAPPGNANFPLLNCWKHLASAGLPILIIKASGRDSHGNKSRMGEFDYLKHVLKLAGRKSQVVVKTIEGTDHSFANRVGRAAVRQHSERWLYACFPLRQYEASAVNTLSSEASDSNDYDKKRQAVQHG
jgi:pimeloyl-ACP methyl ester carboxylesterase